MKTGRWSRRARGVLAGLALLPLLLTACDGGDRADDRAYDGSGSGSPAAVAPEAAASSRGGESASGGAGEDAPGVEGTETSLTLPADRSPEIPVSLRVCAGCHYAVVETWTGHGMAASVGDLAHPSRLPEPGAVTNPLSGQRFEITVRGGEAWLTATTARGGVRRQRLVGRIGAGVFDISWVGEEVDPGTGAGTGRLFFAPVETITGHGIDLSPFELHEGSPGMDMALTGDCLTCHTTTRTTELEGASRAANGRSVYPGHALGPAAFHHLDAIGCAACHGDTSRHRAIATGQEPPREDEGLGIRRMGELTAVELRDVCARCHLQGEVRTELGSGLEAGAPRRDRPLAGQIPVLVPVRDQTGFRFVGQMEQLALSPCFRASPEMTCTTCHDPHTAVRAQGTASFDAACGSCHAHCPRSPDLTVPRVTGRPARTETGCVDCHMPRAEPADLPHIEAADHRVRRRLPAPETGPGDGAADPTRHGLPEHRGVLDREGPMRLYLDPHDDRLTAALATSAGERWRRGVEAMGMVSLGRLEDAAERFAGFPAPGSPEARRPTAPEPLVPLETEPLFHHLRAVVLQATGRFEEALAAYGDALELDPDRAETRVGRAELRLHLGDYRGLVADTEDVIRAHPKAEVPWLLRAEMALRLERPDMALTAFEEVASRWPSNPGVWVQIARLRRALGRPDAPQAESRAEELAPGILGR